MRGQAILAKKRIHKVARTGAKKRANTRVAALQAQKRELKKALANTEKLLRETKLQVRRTQDAIKKTRVEIKKQNTRDLRRVLSSTKKLLEESKRQTRRTTYAIKKFVTAKPAKKTAKKQAPVKRKTLPNGIERVSLPGPRGKTYKTYKTRIEKYLKKEGVPDTGVSYAFKMYGHDSMGPTPEISLDRLWNYFMSYAGRLNEDPEGIENLEIYIMPSKLAKKWNAHSVSKKRTRKRTAKKVSKKTRRKK